jgi:hypothetical protein
MQTGSAEAFSAGLSNIKQAIHSEFVRAGIDDVKIGHRPLGDRLPDMLTIFVEAPHGPWMRSDFWRETIVASSTVDGKQDTQRTIRMFVETHLQYSKTSSRNRFAFK